MTDTMTWPTGKSAVDWINPVPCRLSVYTGRFSQSISRHKLPRSINNRQATAAAAAAASVASLHCNIRPNVVEVWELSTPMSLLLHFTDDDWVSGCWSMMLTIIKAKDNITTVGCRVSRELAHVAPVCCTDESRTSVTLAATDRPRRRPPSTPNPPSPPPPCRHRWLVTRERKFHRQIAVKCIKRWCRCSCCILQRVGRFLQLGDELEALMYFMQSWISGWFSSLQNYTWSLLIIRLSFCFSAGNPK